MGINLCVMRARKSECKPERGIQNDNNINRIKLFLGEEKMTTENRGLENKEVFLKKEIEDKTFVKTIGFLGLGSDSNSVQVDVKNDRIIRIRPLHFDSSQKAEEIKPWKIEAHGQVFEASMKSLVSPLSLTYKNRIYSPNRILYPLKRVDWDPEGERNPQNRGKSKYERISWDKAIGIIVSEIKRVHKQYGLSGVLVQGDGHSETKTVHATHGCHKNLLDMMGGCTAQARNPDSWEGWYWGAKHVWGMEPVGQMQTQSNVFPDIAEHTRLLLFWGCDPETTPWGFNGQMSSRLCYWFTKLGIKSVYICPDLNYGAAVHGDKWIPILPNTDAALQLAIAYIWITENTYEKEYVATHTVGFDKFKDYVLGQEDGIPRTPEWAHTKCGIPAWTIKALAREWASMRTSIAHGNGGCYIRGPYSTEPGRLEVILLGMQGLGRPGCHQVKMLEWGLFGDPDNIGGIGNPPLPRPRFSPSVLAAMRSLIVDPANTKRVISNQFIPKDLIHDALLNPPISWQGTVLARTTAEQQFIKFTYPKEGCSEVHMIWTDGPCWITCWNDSNSYIKGLRSPKIEFIVAQHPWLENDCQFADIILPVNTKFETNDISLDSMNGSCAAVVYDSKCIEPRGESRSDYEVVCAIAEKLDYLKEFTGGKTVDEWIRIGFDNSGIQNDLTFEEFKKRGYYVVPNDPDWKKYPAGLYKFYEDPEKHPLHTPTGKLEFYSGELAKHFPGDDERPPVPHWIEKGESHDERISGTRAKQYPLLVISNHGRWRVHAQHDDATWLREIETCKIKDAYGYGYQPVWMNPLDAAKRGIKHGDIVRIYNERGSVLAGAFVSERMMEGALSIDHGARYDPIVPGELDRGGAINTITPHKITSKNATGMAVGGFLAEVEKADLEGLRLRYPEAFERPYHSGAGLCLERILHK
jgi:molybdopterin guanine dinucleotide-containing S/N-oxide reductase-like protein